jgi:prepilin-type processing-associated H-X9-DG protein
VGVFGPQDLHDLCDPDSPDYNRCRGRGTFFLNEGVSLRNITDGLSNTMIVGERSAKYAQPTWVGVLSGGDHAPARVVGAAEVPPNSEEDTAHAVHDFSSFHPSGTNFLFADGSVIMVRETIDREIYWALSTRAMGDNVGDFGR